MGDKLLQLAFVIAVGGAGALAFGYAAYRRDMVLKQWPSTSATMVFSKIVRTTQARLRSHARDRQRATEPDYKIVDVWALDVQYQYVVNGRDLTGYRATANLLVEGIRKQDTGPGERLRALSAQLPPGAVVPVHYDPGDPSESYLLYIDSPGRATLFRTGAVLAAIGLAVALGSRLLVR
jgi:hypothetical protein